MFAGIFEIILGSIPNDADPIVECFFAIFWSLYIGR